MTRGELLQMLEKRAKAYRLIARGSLERNAHLSECGEVPSQDAIDSVLTDFINNVAYHQGIDLAMKRSDLRLEERKSWE